MRPRRGRPAGQDRGARRFADGRLSACRRGAFPAKLERALKAKGVAVEIANAGVSGDTASGGLARLDWSVPDGTDAVILELGANDMLRGIDPKVTRAALDEILRRLKAARHRGAACGMRARANSGADYARAFDAIYPELASAHDVVFYPFFLDGVAADAKLNQRDGLHPTAAGVDTIVAAHPAEGRGADRPRPGASVAPDSTDARFAMPRLFTGLEIPDRCRASRWRCCAAACPARAGSIPRTIT